MAMAQPEAASQLQMAQGVSLSLMNAFFVSVVLAALFQGIFVTLAAEYYRVFGQSKLERRSVRVYVATLLVLSTAYLAMDITIAYQFRSEMVHSHGTLAVRPSLALTLQSWFLAAFCFTAEFFWVYRAVHVSRNWFARTLATGLWLLALGAFVAQAATVLRERLNKEVSRPEAMLSLLSGIWLYFADTVVCAAILVYELVWKRRKELAKSSLVQQFVALALKTSLIMIFFVAIAAIAITHAFVTGNDHSTGISTAMPNVIPFASCCCIAITLLQRHTLRASLDDEPSARGLSGMGRSYVRHHMSLADALNRISETAAWRGDVHQLGSVGQDWKEDDAEKVVPQPRQSAGSLVPTLSKHRGTSFQPLRPSRSCVGALDAVSALARPSRVFVRSVSYSQSDSTEVRRHLAVESITVSVKVEQQVEAEDEEMCK